MILILPFPNSTNQHWRAARGRHYISAKGLAFRQAVLNQARLQGIKPMTSRLCVEVDLYPPDRRRRDIDNFGGKSLMDALMYAGVFVDDEQIDRLVVQRKEIVKHGQCTVTIKGISDD